MVGALRNCWSRSVKRTKPRCVCPAVIITMAAIVLVTWLLNVTVLPSLYSQINNNAPSLIAVRLRNFSLSELRLVFVNKGNSALQQAAVQVEDDDRPVVLYGGLEAETTEEQGENLKKSLQSEQKIVELSEKERETNPEETSAVTSASQQQQQQLLSVTIFSAPLAYSGEEDEPKRQALLSWLHLSPRPKIVLLGNHSSLHEISKEFAGMVSVEDEIDYSSLNGLPMFHSMVARAHAAVDTNVSVFIRADVVLLQDIMPALRKMSATFDDWMLMAGQLVMKRNLLPFKFVHKGGGIVFLESTITGEAEIEREMASYVGSSGKLEFLQEEEEGLNMWAWNIGSKSAPLFSTPMPPFVFTAGYDHDSWVVRSFLQDGLRTMVDATDALLCFHLQQQLHSRNKIAANNGSSSSSSSSSIASLFYAEEWQHIVNARSYYHAFRNMSLDERGIPTSAWKLIACKDPPTIKLCVSRAVSNSSISCYCSSARPLPAPAFINPMPTNKQTFLEREMSKPTLTKVINISAIRASSPSLDLLLLKVADSSKSIVLVAATEPYSEMLLSFACQAKSLGVQNLLIAAFDEKLYEYTILQGLPVFFAGKDSSSSNESSDDNKVCSFGTECFRRTTKLKSQTVLMILKKGYNVLWSDVDIVWFRNPLPYLRASYGAGTLVVQSDEPDLKSPANGCGRINSGFYYARADKLTITAFSEIVEHAKTTNMSEQPSFNHVLCGEWGQNRIQDSQCNYTNGLQILFLDRLLFPNGIANGYWWFPNVTEACASNGCYVLHNNWIRKMENKVNRQLSTRLWFYDVAGRMCIHSWNALASLGNEQFLQQVNASTFS